MPPKPKKGGKKKEFDEKQWVAYCRADPHIGTFTDDKVWCEPCRKWIALKTSRGKWAWDTQHKSTKIHKENVVRLEQGNKLSRFGFGTTRRSDVAGIVSNPRPKQAPRTDVSPLGTKCFGILNVDTQVMRDQIKLKNEYGVCPDWFWISINGTEMAVRAVGCPTQPIALHLGQYMCANCKAIRKDTNGRRKDLIDHLDRLWKTVPTAKKILEQKEFAEGEIAELKKFTSVTKKTLSPRGQLLHDEAVQVQQYYKRVFDLAKKPGGDDLTPAAGRILSQDAFLDKFQDLYQGPTSTQFKESLVCSLLSVFMSKASSQNHNGTPYAQNLIDFCIGLQSISPAAFDFVSANLGLYSSRTLRRVRQKERKEPFIVDDPEILKTRLSDWVKRNAEDHFPATLSLSFDGVKVIKLLQMHYGYQKVMGGLHPNHLVDPPNNDDS